jgi:hypothetical protein
MRQVVLISFLFFFVTGCNKRGDHVPPGILQPEKMQWVIWDIIRADEFVSTFMVSRDSTLNKDSVRASWYEKVFRVHKINKETFEKSFSFYRAHPEQFKKMMDSLNVKTVKNTTQPFVPKPVIDTSSTAPKLRPIQ